MPATRSLLPDGYHASFIATANSAVTVANAIAGVLNAASSPVTAVVNPGGTVSAASLTLTTKATGASQNGAITLSLVTTRVTAAPSSLSGGAGNTYDTGTVTANISGTAVSTSYGQTSTPQTVAAALATAISGSNAGVTATSSGSGSITVTANQAGTAGNGVTVTVSSATSETKFFSSASFTGTSGTLSGGQAGTLAAGTIYGYNLVTPGGTTGYAANGNLMAYTDQFTGAWMLNYDHLNRASSAMATGGPWNTLSLNWLYDSFGNRKQQTVTEDMNAQITAGVPSNQTFDFLTNPDNRIYNYGINGYDAAGNVLSDGVNHYAYDQEGRLCAVEYVSGTSPSAYIQYIYDAEGHRVGKATINSLQCDPGMQPNNNGFAQTASYVLGLSGEQVSELDGSGAFKRSQVYANGQLLATYTPTTLEFAFGDWLGTKRVVADPSGAVIGNCVSLPFGDELGCTGSLSLDGHHFTGQLHDAESGNDYFGTRYYGEYTGRFMSPDFGGPGPMADPVPWADLENPQSLNLYGYVNNNPLSNTDDDGHDVNVCSNDGNGGQTCKTISNDQYAAAQKAGNGGLNVPTLDQVGMNGNGSGQFNSTAITDSSGNQVGSATYVSNGGADYYANRGGLDYLGGVGAVMNRPSTYAAFYGASALGGAGLVAGGATAGGLTLLGDITLTPTAGEAAYAERLLAQGGRKAVEKAIRTLGKRLAEHQGKLGELQGNPGSVQREIAGFTRTIEALKQVLR